jgi:hypothetical protein
MQHMMALVTDALGQPIGPIFKGLFGLLGP